MKNKKLKTTADKAQNNQLSINSLPIFKSELTKGLQLRVLGTIDNPLFVAKDIAMMLDYNNTKRAIQRHVDNEDKTRWKQVKCNNFGKINFKMQGHTILINKSGVKKLLVKSRLRVSNCILKFFKDKFKITIENKFRYVAKETETISNIRSALGGIKSIIQYKVDNLYCIDLYIPEYNISVECDEYDHKYRNANNEKKRQDYIEEKLKCKFIRYNPDSKNFNIFEVIGDIMNIITKKSKKELIKYEVKKITEKVIEDVEEKIEKKKKEIKKDESRIDRYKKYLEYLEKLKTYTVRQLASILKKLGLVQKGNKKDKQTRLKNFLKKEMSDSGI